MGHTAGEGPDADADATDLGAFRPRPGLSKSEEVTLAQIIKAGRITWKSPA
jgi:hypothetical protein